MIIQESQEWLRNSLCSCGLLRIKGLRELPLSPGDLMTSHQVHPLKGPAPPSSVTLGPRSQHSPLGAQA